MAIDIQTIKDGKISKTFHMENWLRAAASEVSSACPGCGAALFALLRGSGTHSSASPYSCGPLCQRSNTSCCVASGARGLAKSRVPFRQLAPLNAPAPLYRRATGLADITPKIAHARGDGDDRIKESRAEQKRRVVICRVADDENSLSLEKIGSPASRRGRVAAVPPVSRDKRTKFSVNYIAPTHSMDLESFL
jgi:hypothetical protein